MTDSRCFIDSNLWIYRLGNRAEDLPKKDKVGKLVNDNEVYVSTQVMNEVCRNLLYKYNFPESEIEAVINYFSTQFSVLSLDADVQRIAHLLRLNNLKDFAGMRSFWDSMIIAAALVSGVDILYTEDLDNGRVYKIEGLEIKIVNPFV